MKNTQLKALEQRRMQAVALLHQGLSQAEVVRRVGVHRSSVGRWAEKLKRGHAALRTERQPRRELDAEQGRRIKAADLLQDGLPPAEVARQVGARHSTVIRWARILKRGGYRALLGGK